MIPAEPFLFALLACLAVLFAYGFYKTWHGAWRNTLRHLGFATLLVLVGFAIKSASVGSPHKQSLFYFDAYLQNMGSYSTNDTVYVSFTKSGPAWELLLEESPIWVYARDWHTTNLEDFVQIDVAHVFSDYPLEYTLEGATNYDFWVYCNYTPPSPVHTNGVWQTRAFEITVEGEDESNLTIAIPQSTIMQNKEEGEQINE